MRNVMWKGELGSSIDLDTIYIKKDSTAWDLPITTPLYICIITEDKSKMGHLDELKIDSMKLYLPKK